MTVIVNFNVRNPEWYWTAEEIKESEGYYEEWKMLNDSKVPKHTPSWAYQVGFDVKDVKENRNTVYDLKFSEASSPEVIQTIKLEDMTHVVFANDEEKAEVAVSNEIIHSFLGARQSGRKYYWYFFIKENTEYERLTDMIWVSKDNFLYFPNITAYSNFTVK